MIRNFLALAVVSLAGCAQPPEPAPHTDGRIVTGAVQHAQAQIDKGVRQELGK